MSKIDELLKNEKVEWKKLGELLDYEQPDKYIVKSTNYNDNYDTPVLTAGKAFLLGFTEEKDNLYIANKDNPVIIFDDFTAGNHWVDFNFKVKSSAMKMLKPKDGVNLRYCYYYIQTITVDTTEHKRLWISKFSQIEIPIPSLKTQEKIVKTLDKFTNYVTELQTELRDRIKQYEYYRNMLLSEEYLNKLCQNLDGVTNRFEVEYVKLADIAKIISGGDIDKAQVRDRPIDEYIYPVYSNGINEKALYGYTNKYKIDEECVTVSARGTIGWTCLRNEKFYPIVRLICIFAKKDVILNPFLKYYLDVTKFGIPITGIPQLTIPMISKCVVPIPPIHIQKKIVAILDKFQDLLSDTKGLLPKEIEERQKQYEYYRKKLLTFDTECCSKQASKQASK